MANIKQNIRFYQPNDPYYWEVDNLPLTDLLNNDIALQDRLRSLESRIGGLTEGEGGTGGNGTTTGTGSGVLSGSIGLGSIKDLKAYTEPLEGVPARFGKIYVQPGKFLARVQMPGTRENGSGMMRDKCTYFNNEDLYNVGGLESQETQLDFVRESRGLARTAMVEFLTNNSGQNKFISIPSFDETEFNGSDAPLERLDLIYIKGSKPLDCQGDSPTTPSTYNQNHVPQASLGVIKGAYFRTEPVGGVNSNGPRFTDGVERLNGRTIGMANGDIPQNTVLENFGTVPMPDDLVNFAWHRNYTSETQELGIQQLTNKQIEYEAAFSIPIAYVRVPRSYRVGDPINPRNVIDARPFFRSAELDYNERAAIAASVAPNGHNYFITKFNLVNKWVNPLDSRLTTVESTIEGLGETILLNSSRINDHEVSISSLNWAVSGSGSSATTVLGPHEQRIQNLEASAGADSDPLGLSFDLEKSVYFDPITVFAGHRMFAGVGQNSAPQQWNIVSGIPAAHVTKLVAVMFRAKARLVSGESSSAQLLLKGGVAAFRAVCGVGNTSPGSGSGHNEQSMQINSFNNPATELTDSSGNTLLQVYTYTDRDDANVYYDLYIDGYIWRETVSF